MWLAVALNVNVPRLRLCDFDWLWQRLWLPFQRDYDCDCDWHCDLLRLWLNVTVTATMWLWLWQRLWLLFWLDRDCDWLLMWLDLTPTVTVTLTALVLVTETDSNGNCDSHHSFHACTWKMEMGSSRNLNSVIHLIPFVFTPLKLLIL
jgi:hypothetical protein